MWKQMKMRAGIIAEVEDDAVGEADEGPGAGQGYRGGMMLHELREAIDQTAQQYADMLRVSNMVMDPTDFPVQAEDLRWRKKPKILRFMR